MTDQQTVIPPARPQRTMMVKNLMPRLPERGRIKAGELGEKRQAQSGREYGLPRKLAFFRITTLERDANGNFAMDKALHDKLGLGDEPTEIPVRLLYDDVSLNAPTRYASYAGKTLFCSGDGEAAHRISKQAGEKPVPGGFDVACPCHRLDAGYSGKDKCKLNVALSVLIEGAGGVGGVWSFRSTSWNSTTGLLSSMAFIRSVTGGILANIPLKLRLQPKQATNPTDQSSVLIYVASLEFEGDIAELQQIGHKIALDRATTHLSIANIEEEARRYLSLPMPENAVLPGDDDPEAFAAEFYAESVEEMSGAMTPAEPRPTREQFVEKQPDPPHDAETGEIIENEPESAPPEDVELLGAAVTAAKGGAETFRAYWGALSRDDRKGVLPDLVKYQQIAEQADTEKAAPPPETQQEPVERPAIFDELDWKIDAPMMQDKKINYPVLRDKLCSLIGMCESEAELQKMSVDNKTHLEALVKAAPKYAEAVQGIIDTRRQVLGQ